MAKVKSNGTQIYGVVDKEIVAFKCYYAIDLGQDTRGKIEVSCLDDDEKSYIPGSVDPGEGSMTVQLDDESIPHARALQLAKDGTEIEWYIGSKGDELPTISVEGDVTLPTSRNWLTFSGYLNPVAPTIEADGVWTYAFPLVRTTSVSTVLKTA